MAIQTNSTNPLFGALIGKNYRGSGQGVRFVQPTDNGGAPVADDDVVIVASSRTPFGKQNQALSQVNAMALAYVTAKKTIETAGIDPKKIDESIWGNIVPTTAGDAYLPRTVAKMLGMADGSTSKVVQRRCASGFSALEDAIMEIASGKADAVLAGGVENMSMAPLSNFSLPKQLADIAKGFKSGAISPADAQQQFEAAWKPGSALTLEPAANFESTLMGGLTDPLKKTEMYKTADQLADEQNISRADLDALAVESHKRALQAQAQNRFNIAPVKQADIDYVNNILKAQSKLPAGVTEVSKDEGPRQSDIAKLSTLKPNPGGKTHTAATSSQITDGAASVLLTSGKFARENGLKPLAKIRAIGNSGVRPEVMGYGPVPAIKIALDVDGRVDGSKLAAVTLPAGAPTLEYTTAQDMDLIEINEAFAVVPEVAIRELGLDRNKVNVNGSGISLGHPLAATGARIVNDLVTEMKRSNAKLGLGSACIGGGEGAAIIIENVQ